MGKGRERGPSRSSSGAPMGDVSVVKRSARQRSGSAKVRVFDEHMRKEIKRKRLAALEQDNWHEERRVAEEDDDEDYNPLDDGDDSDGAVATSGPKRGKAAKKKKPKPKDVW